ncbi:MAG: glutamate--cysteine ligase [Gammaproteobacteria bacterium]|nr:glutamate--cysteine ligase [Gammaproteobacteria bacterium]
MGQEINKRSFSAVDFELFDKHLKKETAVLRQWFENDCFEADKYVAGLELEACLTDQNFRPANINQEFIERFDSAYLSAELAKFNIELNVDPHGLSNNALSLFNNEMEQLWNRCNKTAALMQAKTLAVGILPTLKNSDLAVKNMSNMLRYQALNEQVLKTRKGRPLCLNIVGNENLRSEHYDVMLESAATSLQLHLQVPQDKAVAYYNASVFVSAFTVAASANSPYLFEKNLWQESRIPLFEQAVETGGYASAAEGPLHRVSFGSDYCRRSLMECFDENLNHFPVLLPMRFSSNTQEMQYLRLQNGTIWRWNRPILGFNNEGVPHLRIEHRVMPAGPTVKDQTANMALYYGLVNYFAEQEPVNGELAEFATAKDNFYEAARYGIAASVKWSDGNKYSIKRLFDQRLINCARAGLQKLGIDKKDSDYYLDIIEQRVGSGCTGSNWQQQFVARYGKDMTLLTEQYYIRQNSGKCVHEWDWELLNAE